MYSTAVRAVVFFMKNVLKTPDLPETPIEDTPHILTPSEEVHAFLIEKGYVPKVTAVNQLNVWVGDGYILNDKPLLKVTYEKKEP